MSDLIAAAVTKLDASVKEYTSKTEAKISAMQAEIERLEGDKQKLHEKLEKDEELLVNQRLEFESQIAKLELERDKIRNSFDVISRECDEIHKLLEAGKAENERLVTIKVDLTQGKFAAETQVLRVEAKLKRADALRDAAHAVNNAPALFWRALKAFDEEGE